jgi:HSP20 family molecular chaperone IbpA
MSKVGAYSDTAKHHSELRRLHQDQADKIEQTKKLHHKNLEKVKEDQTVELNERRGELQKNIDTEMIQKNEQLESIRANLKVSQQKMQEQLADLETSHKKNLANINSNFKEMSSEEGLEKTEDLKLLNSKYQNLIQQTHNDGKFNINQTKSNLDRKKMALDQHYERKLDDTKYKNEFALKQQNDQHSQTLSNQQVEHERNLNNLKSDFYKKSIEETQRFEQGKEKTTEIQTKLIEQEQRAFENRYKALVDEQNKLIDKLNQKSQELINQQKSQFISTTQNIQNKSQDRFYQMRDIEPLISDKMTHLEVKIPVAEHEKDSVRLNVLKRKLKVTLDRKFEDKIETEASKISNTKVESMTKEIAIDQLLDSKKIERNYVDGYLVYNIAKL